MESNLTDISKVVGPVIQPTSKTNLTVKQGDHVILLSNDKRYVFGVAKPRGYDLF